MKRLSVAVQHGRVLLLCLVITSCGGNDNPSGPDSDGSLTLEPNDVRAVIGQTVRFKQSGASEADWASSNPAVARFDRIDGDTGVFICVGSGKTTITAKLGDQVNRASIEVIRSGRWLTSAAIELRGFSFPNFLDVQFLDAQYGWLVGASHNGAIGLRTTDGGRTWQEKFPRFQIEQSSVFFLNRQVGWIGGGRLFKTTDSGETWNFVNNRGTGSLVFLDENLGFMASGVIGGGFDLRLHKTVNGGLQWTVVEAVPEPVERVFFIDRQYGWAAGKYVYHTTNGGTTWTRNALDLNPQNETLYVDDLNFTDRQRGWVLVRTIRRGTDLYFTTDGGATFTSKVFTLQPDGSNDRSVYFFADDSGWSVTEQGGFFQTADGGMNGVRQGDYKSIALSKVNFISNDFGYAFGASAGGAGLFIYFPSN